MKALLTGGTGFVGKALVSRLLVRGDEVAVTTRDPERARGSLENADVPLIRWNGTDLLDLRGFDVVIHLAGEPAVGVRYTEDMKRRIRSSRVDSAEALLRSLADAGPSGPRRLLSASGVGYYGAAPGDRTLDERAPAGDDFLARVCVEWEAAVKRADGLGVSTASMRFGVILAPEGGALEVMARPFRLFAGGPLGDGQQVLSWIHLDDVLGGIEFLLDRPELSGPFNFAAPHAVTNQIFGETLGRVLGRPSLLRTPAFALRALFGEGADPILTGQRAVPKRLVDAGFTFRFPDLEPALRACLRP
jgi:uncharacterized protein